MSRMDPLENFRMKEKSISSNAFSSLIFFLKDLLTYFFLEIVFFFLEINNIQQTDITQTDQLTNSFKASLILPAFIMYLIVWGK